MEFSAWTLRSPSASSASACTDADRATSIILSALLACNEFISFRRFVHSLLVACCSSRSFSISASRLPISCSIEASERRIAATPASSTSDDDAACCGADHQDISYILLQSAQLARRMTWEDEIRGYRGAQGADSAPPRHCYAKTRRVTLGVFQPVSQKPVLKEDFLRCFWKKMHGQDLELVEAARSSHQALHLALTIFRCPRPSMSRPPLTSR